MSGSTTADFGDAFIVGFFFGHASAVLLAAAVLGIATICNRHGPSIRRFVRVAGRRVLRFIRSGA